MRWLVGVLCLAWAATSWQSVHAEDEEVQSAIQAYRKTLEQQKELLEAAFDRKIKEVQREGNLKQLETLESAKHRFLRFGELPDSKEMKAVTEKYRKALEVARTKVNKTYDTRIKSLTRERKFEDAQSLRDDQQKLDTLLADPKIEKPIQSEPTASTAAAPESGYDRLPDRVVVLPIAFIPSDQKPPTANEESQYLRHLSWAQERYGELLKGDTFEFASSPPKLLQIPGRRTLAVYRSAPEGGAPMIVSEILDHLQLNRFENPNTFAILLMNAVDRFPVGGGRPINGGTNAGGGMFYIGSGELVQNPHFQCTLQHELGHSFGLPHVNVYGYSMETNMSLMSYNPAHHNQGFQPSATPGILNPEDIRVLALNDRMFLKTTFDVRRDVSAGYSLSRYVIPLGPMTLPGHPNFYPTATPNVGSNGPSQPERCLYGFIRPSEGPGVTYDPDNMWHTVHQIPAKQASLDITFPFPVEIDGLGVHTQHSAMDHHATHIRVQATDAQTPIDLADQDLDSIDAEFPLPKTRSQKWRLELTPGPSKTIVVRGIRFLKNGKEIYPRMAPYGSLKSIP